MLSRIAESLFWIGRYVERAEDTARILDVQTQLILEDPYQHLRAIIDRSGVHFGKPLPFRVPQDNIGEPTLCIDNVAVNATRS